MARWDGLTLEQRVWSKVDRTGSCWEWQARVGNHGYGEIMMPSGKKLAHRVVWEMEYGEIPDGMLVLHTCDNRRCVRPEHLWLGTNLQNMQDMARKGRAHWSRRTECLNGHPRTERNCRTCRAESEARHQARRKARSKAVS